MRKLVTLRKVSSVSPIPGADNIEKVSVDGWDVVAKKGEFRPGDIGVYFEIDSWVPNAVAPFLTKPGKEPSVYEGVSGERLRTVKLRGQVSQGLLLPLSALEQVDLSSAFGVTKWERPFTGPGLAGSPRGNFPSSIPKTDQERVQNMPLSVLSSHSWHVTEKLEGSSMTCYLIDGVFGVCSRNIDLKEEEGNTFWKVARMCNVEKTLREVAMSYGITHLAIQGELIGPGIQGNIYKLDQHQFHMFDVLVYGKKQSPNGDVWGRILEQSEFAPVPAIDSSLAVLSAGDGRLKEMFLDMADGTSRIGNCLREGLVFRSKDDPELSFKAVSNKYLLGE